MTEKNIVLEVRHLKKYYPVRTGVFSRSREVLKAVDDVSFTIPEGGVLGLVGESGCGKTTVGSQIALLEAPTAGEILFEGRKMNGLSDKDLKPYRTQIQMVFQDSYSSLNPRKRVRDILGEPMLYHHVVTEDKAEARCLELLDMVGLPHNSLDRFPHEFSGGQRQRICIARALSLNPKMLVCDEPTSALDVSIQAQILNLFKELQKSLGLTMLFIGHGLGAVNYVSDRIAVMYLGKLVETGESQEIFRHPVHPYTKALLAAVPEPDPDRRNPRLLLKGEAQFVMVSEDREKSGCLFAPRCPFARPECHTIDPQLEELADRPGHCSACPFVKEAL
jgi:oligopeptide/dipeptide ABC transporter ATP-binding protein